MAGNVMTLLSFMIGIFSFLVLSQVQNSNAYPTGAVTSACGDMTPNHGVSSQTSVSPYTISVSPAFYQPRQQMTVTISSNAGSPALKGILLQARLTGTDQIIGIWSLEGTTGFQTLACNGVNSAVTHTSSDDKPATFQLNWTPPNVNGTDIYVTATFVQTRPVFWVAQRTSDIQVGPCDSDPCVNGGTCTHSAGDTTFTCSCPFPFGGPTCQTGTTTETTQGTTPGTTPRTTPQTTPAPCNSSLCQNGGTCTVTGVESYSCSCPPLYTGNNCQTLGLAHPQIQPMSSVQPLTSGQRVALDCTVTNANMDENIEWYHDSDVISFGQSLLRDREGAYTLQVTQEKGVPSTYHWIITIANADIIRDEGSWSCSFFGPPVQEVVTDLLVIVDPCSSTPCQNGGQCNAADDFSSFTCQCVSPYTGTTCNQSPCDSNPCFNGGTCGITATGYMCNCPPTHTGERCETDVTPDCTNSLPCQNGGTCALVQASYQCQCTPLFEGAQCGLDITDCRSPGNSCVNGGTCQSLAGIYACVCPEFFQLPRCIVELRGCLRYPCQNGGTCAFKEDVDPVCECPVWYAGSQCEIALTCDSSPCQNGGTCFESGTAGSGGFLCLCPTGYTGLSCETEKCTASPCRNGGTCMDETTVFNCQCPAGYIGDRCNISVQACISSPCQNGGTCSGDANGYTCQCPVGFDGVNCENTDSASPCDSSPCGGNGATCLEEGGGQSYFCICPAGSTPQPNCEVQACSSSPCQNGGTCSGDANGYTCQCLVGFGGVNCENTVLNCSSSPCQNGGTCFEEANGYTCCCPSMYTGTNCEVLPCELSSPCRNGATCQNIEDVMNDLPYTCMCAPGFDGPSCENAIPCESSPCQNDGICFGSGSGAGYLCQCPTGYTGLNCETEICTASTCHNGGTCINEITGFNCQCPAGYIGDRCEIPVTTSTLCNHSPCQNGGTCNQRSDTAYTCACPATYVGTNCDIPAPCNPRPCQNGGTCTVTGLESYSCACPPLYTGINCQTLGKHVS